MQCLSHHASPLPPLFSSLSPNIKVGLVTYFPAATDANPPEEPMRYQLRACHVRSELFTPAAIGNLAAGMKRKNANHLAKQRKEQKI
jgi:hypothetical protein